MQIIPRCHSTALRAENPGANFSVVTQPRAPARPTSVSFDVQRERRTVYVVDYDVTYRIVVRFMLERYGYRVKDFSNCEAFLAECGSRVHGCLVVDSLLLGMHGFEMISQIAKVREDFKCVVTARNATLPIAVQAIKAGATDFIAKSLDCSALLASVSRAFDEAVSEAASAAKQNGILRRISSLTVRQHQVLEMVLEGEPSKRIATNLGISRRTVENHRAAIARKAGSKSFAGLIHAGVCAHCRLNGASHAIEIRGA